MHEYIKIVLTLEVTTGPNSARAISANRARAEIRPDLVWRCSDNFRFRH